jgi:stage II sporulation protein D
VAGRLEQDFGARVSQFNRNVKRSRFLLGALLGSTIPRAALATGGLDVGGPVALHQMRVLLASGRAEAPQALDEWHFAWGGRTFRGSASFEPLGDGQTGLVNTLPLDAYLYGVVSSEVAPSWPAAAQQAQAIVARTYALGKLRPERAYDVTASDSDQHYGGIEAETVEGRSAVDQTGGLVVTYLGLPAQVAYSSCCGGRTVASLDVWGHDFPYLLSQDDPHCAGTPEYSWFADVSLADVRRACGPEFGEIGVLKSVALRDVDGSKRPRTVTFAGDRSSCDVETQRFRMQVGPSLVRSTYLHAVNLAPAGLGIDGSGRGHGVGMCQWGARMLGAQGAGARDIVSFYFPGTAFGRG